MPRVPVTRTLSAAVSWPGGSSLSRIAPLADPASDFTLHAEPGMPAATTVDVADLQHPAITWTGAPPADAIELGFSADALNFAVWLPASAAGSFRLPDVPAAWQKPAGKPWGAFLYMGWDEDAASGYAETFVWKSGAPSGAYTGAMGRVVP